MSEYKRPISLVDFEIAIKDISDEELKLINKKLEVSIRRLQESNELMENLMDKEKRETLLNQDNEFEIPTDEDIKIYKDSINENKNVIENQNSRCKLIADELQNRGIN